MNDKTWTWVSGSNFTGQPGVYGEIGIPNVNNTPGSRDEVIGWCDGTTREVWIFGGESSPFGT